MFFFFIVSFFVVVKFKVCSPYFALKERKYVQNNAKNELLSLAGTLDLSKCIKFTRKTCEKIYTGIILLKHHSSLVNWNSVYISDKLSGSYRTIIYFCAIQCLFSCTIVCARSSFRQLSRSVKRAYVYIGTQGKSK